MIHTFGATRLIRKARKGEVRMNKNTAIAVAAVGVVGAYFVWQYTQHHPASSGSGSSVPGIGSSGGGSTSGGSSSAGYTQFSTITPSEFTAIEQKVNSGGTASIAGVEKIQIGPSETVVAPVTLAPGYVIQAVADRMPNGDLVLSQNYKDAVNAAGGLYMNNIWRCGHYPAGSNTFVPC